MHQAVGGDRRLPAEGLVDALGVPSVSTSRSSGPRREAERRARRAACSAPPSGRPASGRRDRPREGRLVAEAARARRSRPAASAADAARGRCGSRWNAPRCRAWRASRPAGRSSSRARRPAQSVQGMSSVDLLARRRHAPARRRCGGSCRPGCRMRSATASGAYLRIEIALGHQLERRHRLAPVGQRAPRRPAPARRPRPAHRQRLPRSSQHSGLPLGVAREQPVIRGARRPGSPARARWCSAPGNRDRSCRPCSSSCISDRTNSPSVPGRMPIHSSAIAE